MTQLLLEDGPLPSHQAARIVADVLDALSCIHGRGDLHGGIHPDNILLTANRETLLLNANTPLTGHSHASELFAVGALLLEMLTGNTLNTASATETLAQHNEIDETLAAIIIKATSPEEELRYPDACSMRSALQQYLDATGITPAATNNPHSTLDFLLRRMRSKSDFPALSSIISEINKCVSSELENSNKIAQIILQDFALTNKIIKLVNTVAYRRFGSNIHTISKAVGILGYETIRNIAMTLILLNFLQNKTQAQDLKDEVITSFLAGLIAAELNTDTHCGAAEEAMICAMFHNLGRMLAKFYFFEESQEVNRLMQDQKISEKQASLKVLGISYNELGVGIAETWGLPPLLTHGMAQISGDITSRPTNKDDRLRVTANMANELCNIATKLEKSEKHRALRQLTIRYTTTSDLSEDQLSSALESSLGELSNRASIVGIEMAGSPLLKKVRTWCGQTVPEENTDESCVSDDITPDETPNDMENILSAGIQDVTNTLAGDYRLNDVLQMVLEAIYRGLNFQHTLVLIRDNKKDAMTARFGFGDNIDSIIPNFHFPLAFAADVFHIATEKGLDICIDDVTASNISNKIPAWYHKTISSQSFLLLPIMINKKAIGMIYADTAKTRKLKLSEKQLALLRTLRNQAVIAIKQKT